LKSLFFKPARSANATSVPFHVSYMSDPEHEPLTTLPLIYLQKIAHIFKNNTFYTPASTGKKSAISPLSF